MADEQKPGGSEAAPPPGARPRNNRRNQPPKPLNRAPPKPAAPASQTAGHHGGDPLGERPRPRTQGTVRRRTSPKLPPTSGRILSWPSPGAAIPLLEYLKLEADFDYLVDITAVDWPKRAERFDVVYILYSFSRNERVRVKINIADGYQPETAVGVHLTANWLEREVFDMFGIEFAGHPDMRRILHARRVAGLSRCARITAFSSRTTAGCRKTWESKAASDPYAGRHIS